MEEWLLIPDHGGFYKISNLGRIFGVRSNKILSQYLNDRGYLASMLGRTHILVCRTFHGPKPFPTALALHKDDVKTNNTSDNLYWGDDVDNAKDRVLNDLTTVGEKNGQAKLDWYKVRLARQLYKEGKSYWELAIQFGVGHITMRNVVFELTWKEP